MRLEQYSLIRWLQSVETEISPKAEGMLLTPQATKRKKISHTGHMKTKMQQKMLPFGNAK